MKEIADVLREYQYENSLTQHDMAKLLEIAQPTYNNWVNGQARVNPAKYYDKIAKLCKIDVELILPKKFNIENKIEQNQDSKPLRSALEFCQKYSKNLEEINEILRKENAKLIIDLIEKDEIITSLRASQ